MKIISIAGVFVIGAMAMTTKPAKPAGTMTERASPAETMTEPASPAETMTEPASPAQGGIQASITRGKQVYLEQCLACHQADGSGVPNMNPPLIKSKYVQGDKSALIKIVLNGMHGVKIGDDDYTGVMAPHPDLTDQQIADVLTFVRNNFENKASAVTAAQVKTVRATNKS